MKFPVGENSDFACVKIQYYDLQCLGLFKLITSFGFKILTSSFTARCSAAGGFGKSYVPTTNSFKKNVKENCLIQNKICRNLIKDDNKTINTIKSIFFIEKTYRLKSTGKYMRKYYIE